MRRAKRIKIDHNSEFELDLAPLLAVMVKLVPVLLVSSAFVQLMVVETELPQVVQQALEQQEQKKDQVPVLTLEPDSAQGIRIVLTEKGNDKVELVPLKDAQFDLVALHAKLVSIKQSHPEIFRIEIKPEAKVSYREIIKIMDEARQSRDSSVKFPVFDSKQNKTVETNYMFPEVIFANTMEG